MKKWQKLMRSGKSIGNMFGEVTKKAAKWGLGIATAAITAATAIGGMAINTTQDMNKATDSFIASTGLATEKTEQYNQVLGNIYKNNYGEDFQDIADSMAQVKTQLGDISDTELQNVTEDALALRDTFGFEVNESVRAAKMLMDQFGISSSEAYNLIAQGAQQGLDKNGDLLDSINEYSVHFKQNGLSATDMFNTFKQGAESGAFSIDKVGDAIKEMGIRMKDGSATDSLKAMKLDADEITQAFGEGGEKASWAFGEVVNGLKNIKDPIEQNNAGVAIFGTMWEDLGKDAVFAMTEYGDAFDETLNTMNQIKEVKYDNLSDMFQALKRNIEMLLVPLGNALMPILQQIIQFIMNNMPAIEGVFESITPVITGLFEQLLPPLMELMQSIMPIIFNLLQQIIPFISEFAQIILPILVQVINMLLPPILQIVEAVLPVLIQLLQPILQLLEPLIQLLQPIIDLFMQLLQPLIELINMILPPLISLFSNIIQFILPGLQSWLGVVASVISGVFLSAFESIKTHVELVKNTFQNVLDFIKNIFTGNWKGAWENVKNIFSNIISGLGNIFKAPINLIISGINGFIRGLNKIKIPDWVPAVGGLSLNIKEIPKLKVGIDYVPEDDFPALLHKGEAVLTKEQNAEYIQAKSRQQNIGYGSDNNSSNLEYLVQKLIDILLTYFPHFEEIMRQPLVTDDGTIIAYYTPKFNEELNRIKDKEERGS